LTWVATSWSWALRISTLYGAAPISHGVLGLSTCFPEPALLTSLGVEGDGLIEASQLLDHELKAQIVVPSARDTAAGGKLDEASGGLGDGGDALSGLARAFVYTGVRNVLGRWTPPPRARRWRRS
jgi:CHAT domain-containing protein